MFGLVAPRLGQDRPGGWHRAYPFPGQLADFFFHVEGLLLAGHGRTLLRFEYIASRGIGRDAVGTFYGPNVFAEKVLGFSLASASHKHSGFSGLVQQNRVYRAVPYCCDLSPL